MKDYYKILGVGRDATPEQIKKAFRGLARDTHPDANPDDPEAESRFREIAEAYEVLSDPQRKGSYDRGEVYGGGDLFSQFGGLDEILQQFFGGGFGGFGGVGGRRTGPRRGTDIGATVSLTLADAATGATREFEFRAPGTCDRCDGVGAEPGHGPTTCPTCRGAGSVQVARDSFLGRIMTVAPCAQCAGRGQKIDHPCTQCEGGGLVTVDRSVTVDVPPGVEDGTRLRLSGRGGAGERGAPAGDVYVEIGIEPDERFDRIGDELHHRVEIGISEAVFGVTVEVPVIDGEPESIDLPAGTQPETVYRLSKKGMPRLRRRGRGEMFVHIGVTIPTDLSEEQEETLRTYAELRDERPAARKRGLFRR
ncbi:MAG: J domain-containing protein [Acidimicrobiia bacterium]|nr:J domain-containing protein [Acidimicrobiia bacterium]